MDKGTAPNRTARLSGAADADPSLPFGMVLLIGAPLWGAAMVLSLLLWQWHANRLLTFHLWELCGFFFAGGILGWLASLPIARRISRNRRQDYRLAACFFGLILGTTGFTALLVAIQYRAFYARWHDPFVTVTWCIQLVTTLLGSIYQFLVLGLPNYLPVALPLGLIVSFALAKRMR